jgi:hypothetical protein
MTHRQTRGCPDYFKPLKPTLPRDRRAEQVAFFAKHKQSVGTMLPAENQRRGTRVCHSADHTPRGSTMKPRALTQRVVNSPNRLNAPGATGRTTLSPMVGQPKISLPCSYTWRLRVDSPPVQAVRGPFEVPRRDYEQMLASKLACLHADKKASHHARLQTSKKTCLSECTQAG